MNGENKQLLNLMGLARRAGRLSLGSDPVIESLRKGQARLVILAKLGWTSCRRRLSWTKSAWL